MYLVPIGFSPPLPYLIRIGKYWCRIHTGHGTSSILKFMYLIGGRESSWTWL